MSTDKKKRLLSDHKRSGKKLVPPMMQLGTLHLTSWMDNGLPEALWVAVLHEKLGFHEGVERAVELSKAAQSVKESGCVVTSDFDDLSEGDWTKIRAELPSASSEVLVKAMAPFLRLYPDCALRNIAGTELEQCSDEDIHWMRSLLAELFDKGGREATMALATQVYLRMAQGRLVINPGSGLENLNAIEEYPDTAESRRVGSLVRAATNSFTEAKEPGRWPRYFWTRGFSLQDCEFSEADSDSD